MINRVLRLFVFQIKEKSIGVSFKSKKNTAISLVLRTAFIFAVAMIISSFLGYLNFRYRVRLNEHILAFLIAVVLIITIASSIFTANSMLFNKNDNEFLMSFPVTPTDIFASKIMLSFIRELINSVSLFLPVLIGFGMASSKGLWPFISNFPLYVFLSVLGTIILPFLSLSIALIFVIPIQYIKQLLKKRIWTSLLALAIAFTLIFLFYSFIISLLAENLNIFRSMPAFVKQFNDFVLEFSSSKPYLLWIVDMLLGKKLLLGLSLVIGIAIVAMMISLLISRYFYFKLALTNDTSSKTVTAMKNNNVTKSKLLAVIKKDVISILRDSNGIFENFAMFILLPFFIYFISKFSVALSLRDIGILYMLAAIVMIFAIFTFSGNQYISKAISREGPNLYILKNSPVAFKQQVLAKIIVSNVVAFASILASCILFASVTIFSFWQGFMIFIIIFIFNFAHSLYSYELEITKPITNWYDSNEVKNSKNSSLSVSFGFGLGAFIAYLAFTFFRFLPETSAWLHLIVLAVGYAIYRIYALNKRANYLIKRMEL